MAQCPQQETAPWWCLGSEGCFKAGVSAPQGLPGRGGGEQRAQPGDGVLQGQEDKPYLEWAKEGTYVRI